jgi:hypothetical protein
MPPHVSSGHQELQFPSREFGSLEEIPLVLVWLSIIIIRRGKKFFGGCDVENHFNQVYIQLAEARPLKYFLALYG